MVKKVLVVSTSLRGNSNSEILAKECERGAKDAGHEVEFVSLRDKDILKVDVAEIMAKVKESEVVVFATPIYYYEMCGQMKTLLDRLNPLYESDYKFRDIYMLATAADDDAHATDKAYNGLQGWVDCFEKAELKGYAFGKGIAEPGDAKNHAETLLDAYNLGKSL